MPFIPKIPLQVGEIVKTTVDQAALNGTIKTGTLVTIIGISEMGYDIEDCYGNRILECGSSGFERVFPNEGYF